MNFEIKCLSANKPKTIFLNENINPKHWQLVITLMDEMVNKIIDLIILE